jgi:hypothetical protein
MKPILWIFAPILLAGCAMHSARDRPMPMSSMDMAAMCDMHKEMMSGKTPEQRQAMMAKHMKAMSPETQQHMQMMMQQCK